MIDTMAAAGITGIAAFIVARFQAKLVANRRRRDTIEHDLRIWKELPTESAARSEFLAHIDLRLTELMTADKRRRDWSGLLGGIVFIILLPTAFAFWKGPSWADWAPVAFSLIAIAIGALMFWEAWGKVERDGSGVRVTGALRPRRRRVVADGGGQPSALAPADPPSDPTQPGSPGSPQLPADPEPQPTAPDAPQHQPSTPQHSN